MSTRLRTARETAGGPPDSTSTGMHRSVLLLLAMLTALAFAVLPMSAARAADFGTTPITGVTLTPGVIGHAGTARVDFTWVAPAGAQPGDTFSITLPDELEPSGTRDILLVDEVTGEVALRGVWSGKTTTFTFQDYITTHTGVGGTGFFYVKWDQDNVGQEEETFDSLIIGGFDVGPITKQASDLVVVAPNRDTGKIGGWTDETQTLFRWILVFPGSTTEAFTGPVVLTDILPPDPGYSFDCAGVQMRVDLGGFPSPTGDTNYVSLASTPNATSSSCTSERVDLTLSSIPAGTFLTLILPVAVVDPDREDFDNTATFDWPALNDQPHVESSQLRRDDAGGTVVGEVPEVPPPPPPPPPPPQLAESGTNAATPNLAAAGALAIALGAVLAFRRRAA